MAAQKLPQFFAFTVKSQGRLNAIITKIEISQPVNPPGNTSSFITTKALWDTGATNTCISGDIARKLNLLPVNYVNVVHAGGSERVPFYVVDLILPNNVMLPGAGVSQFVAGSDGVDVIIGMDIITAGDFAVTNVNKQTMVSFRLPSLQSIDYVEEMKALQQRNFKNVGRNDICPCGSGLKYKHCHGKNH